MPPGDQEPGQELPKQALMTHLKALRNMLLISAGAVGVGFLVVFLGFVDQILLYLEAPVQARGIQLIYIALAESIVIKMKVAFIAGIIAASPVIFWQIWAFLRPALYPHEGRIVVVMFFLTVILFLLGSVFSYFIVFRLAIEFFQSTGQGIAVTPFISIEKYVDFLVAFVLPFGLMFELPIVMSLLTRANLVQVSAYGKFRKYVIFAIFVVAAILTPPDVISQVLLAVPLLLLYEIGIIVAKITRKRADKRALALENGA